MSETSVMCHTCDRLVGGVPAGRYVRWVECGCINERPWLMKALKALLRASSPRRESR